MFGKPIKMHSKIKQLYNKAFVEYEGASDCFIPDTFIEKFANLIVQECLDSCYNRGMNDSLYEGQLKAAAYIEEKFGIKCD